MLTKIIFTLIVIVIVALVFRNKQASRPAEKVQPTDVGSLSTRTVAYCILALLITISITVFIFSYRADNQIITIRVISEDGNSTIYQAKQKFIKGRQFQTLDGTQVSLGESDRIEKDNP
jgi:Na+/H+ antiporter NhaC